MSTEYVNGLYKLKRPGFEDIGFTKAHDELYWPTAVDYASKNEGVLQSARECAAFRVEAGSQDKADFMHITRTPAIFFKDKDKYYVAFDDSTDPKTNIVLARSLEGFGCYKRGASWLLPKKDNYVCGLLKRAEKMCRIAAIPEIFNKDEPSDKDADSSTFELLQEEYHLDEASLANILEFSPEDKPDCLDDVLGPDAIALDTKGANGKSEFGQHPLIRALFLELAEPYANYLAQRKNYSPLIYTLTAQELDELPYDTVEVRGVSLGDAFPCDFDGIGICDLFINDGLVRAIHKRKSPA